ncbi:MAG: DUF5777 family beta-barrel protein [Flavobacteriaceae bacterium]|nr:DUF5777 family beta-barrel protein [Flavobacteriaceae bacterium]
MQVLQKTIGCIDFNAKYALLRQTRSGKMPINLTYYGNFAYDGRDQENTNFNYDQDQFFLLQYDHYFTQIKSEFLYAGRSEHFTF